MITNMTGSPGKASVQSPEFVWDLTGRWDASQGAEARRRATSKSLNIMELLANLRSEFNLFFS